MTDLEVQDLVVHLVKTDIFGRARFPAFRGLKMPKVEDVMTYLNEGRISAKIKGVNISQVEPVIHYLCDAAKFMSTEICPKIGQ